MFPLFLVWGGLVLVNEQNRTKATFSAECTWALVWEKNMVISGSKLAPSRPLSHCRGTVYSEIEMDPWDIRDGGWWGTYSMGRIYELDCVLWTNHYNHEGADIPSCPHDNMFSRASFFVSKNDLVASDRYRLTLWCHILVVLLVTWWWNKMPRITPLETFFSRVLRVPKKYQLP